MTQTMYLETTCDGPGCDRNQRIVMSHRDHNFPAPKGWTRIAYENDTWRSSRIEHYCGGCASVLLSKLKPWPLKVGETPSGLHGSEEEGE